MDFLIRTVIPFFAGFVVCANLVSMIGINANYHGSWERIVICVFLAFSLPILRQKFYTKR